MKILLALAALLFASPVLAQANPPASAFPSPAVGEFGPREAAPDGLVFNDLLTGNGTVIAPSGVPDTVGAFRFVCTAGQNNTDDPVVYPGQKGKSHNHQFYGNKSVNWLSNYDNLRANGDSTCVNRLNRSGYWVPGIDTGTGLIKRPDYIQIYYKREPKGSPECTLGDPKFVGICVGIPNAIRFIFGADLVSFTTPTGATGFKCVNAAGNSNRSDFKQSMVEAATFCQDGDRLDLLIAAPACWNGTDLDSPNHRSHVAYQLANYKCPSTHPYYMPHFLLQAFYSVDQYLDRSGTYTPGVTKTWRFSSDVDFNKAPGVTFHADYFEGWNPKAKKAWEDNCIDKLLSCTGGDLGNGYAMKLEDLHVGPAVPAYIPVPARAMEPFKATIGHRH